MKLNSVIDLLSTREIISEKPELKDASAGFATKIFFSCIFSNKNFVTAHAPAGRRPAAPTAGSSS
jgi:hypothetical protein